MMNKEAVNPVDRLKDLMKTSGNVNTDELYKIIKTMSETMEFVYVIHASNNYVAALGMTPETAQKFHEYVQEFIDKPENKFTVSVSNIPKTKAIQEIQNTTL